MLGLHNGDISTGAVMWLTIIRKTEHLQRLDKDLVRGGHDFFASGYTVTIFV